MKEHYCRSVVEVHGDFDGVISCIRRRHWRGEHEGLLILDRDGCSINKGINWYRRRGWRGWRARIRREPYRIHVDWPQVRAYIERRWAEGR